MAKEPEGLYPFRFFCCEWKKRSGKSPRFYLSVQSAPLFDNSVFAEYFADSVERDVDLSDCMGGHQAEPD